MHRRERPLRDGRFGKHTGWGESREKGFVPDDSGRFVREMRGKSEKGGGEEWIESLELVVDECTVGADRIDGGSDDRLHRESCVVSRESGVCSVRLFD